MDAKLLTLVVVGVFLCTPMAFVDTDAADPGFNITDDDGDIFHFEGAANKIVACGLGTVLTIADAGEISKIVGVDKYSTYEYTKNEKLKDLDAIDLKSFYGETNHSGIKTELINMVDSGKLSLDDPIILTTYEANKILKEDLLDLGFTHVLRWATTSLGSYDDLMSFVKNVTMIATGEEGTTIRDMESKVDQVTSVVSNIPEDKMSKALTVWCSASGDVKVTNKGIAHSMIGVCNATHVGYDDSKGSYYGDVNTVISLLEENPGTVIFLSDKWASSGKTIEDFRNEILAGNTDFKIIQMGPQWNNYCPESADGLLEMAKALYPEEFGVTPEDDPTNSNGNGNMTMWVIALIAAIIIGAAAYVAFKRTHK